MYPKLVSALSGCVLAACGLCLIAGAQDEPTSVRQICVSVSAAANVPASWPDESKLLISVPGVEQPVRHSLQGQVPETLALNLDLESGRARLQEVTLSLESPGIWASDLSIALADESCENRLNLWPSARVTARLKPEEGQLPPESLTADLTIAGRGSAPQIRASVRCPVSDDELLTCSVPATRFDLRLGGGPYVPHYRWGVLPTAGELRPLGTLRLVEGPSMSGRVLTRTGALDPSQTTVRLIPLQGPGTEVSQGDRVRQTARTVGTDAGGFFQFIGLRPGQYIVEASHPGYASARMFPVGVHPGSESILPLPLELDLPLSITLDIHPPLDWREQPWMVRMTKRGVGTAAYDEDPIYRGEIPADGTLILPGQSPGSYALSVADSLGNRFWFRDDLRIETESDAWVQADIDLIPLRGRVRFGDEPIQAKLYFGGRFGSVGLSFSTDDEGRFDGYLPKAGHWRVEVETETPVLRSRHLIEIPDDSDRQVLLEIPDTWVEGLVLDNGGQPVAGAHVMAEAAGDSFQTRTDPQGRFEFRGVPEKLLRLVARGQVQGKTEHSRVQETVPLTNTTVGPILLRLEPLALLKGQVVSGGSPIAGASLQVLPSPDNPGFGANARTDLSGTFSVEMPETTRRLHLLVAPPGHGLKAFEIDTHYGREIVLNIPEGSGTLEIVASSDPEDFMAANLGLRFEQNGIGLSKSQLAQWAVAHGGSFDWRNGFRIPRVAPGNYRICVYGLETTRVDDLRRGQCVDGDLSETGTLTLIAPVPESQEDEARGQAPHDKGGPA